MLPSIQDTAAGDRENPERRSSGHCDRTAVDRATLVSSATQTRDSLQTLPETSGKPRWARTAPVTLRRRVDKRHKINGLPFLAHSLRKYKLKLRTLNHFAHIWRKSTIKSYTAHLNRWSLWAYEHDVPILNPEISNVLDFLGMYFDTGVGYGAINTARCALSLILPRDDGRTIGEHFLIKWFCKSCYEQRPPQPKYANFWSVDIVLVWIEGLGSNTHMSMKLLSFKLVMLLLLVTSQRGQTILNLCVDRMLCTKKAITFKMKKLLKHNQRGQPLDSITLFAYTKNKKLCVVRTLSRYLERTTRLRRGNSQLLLSYIAPFKPIARATLARWTVNVLSLAGIDTTQYKGHSTRGATASAALNMGVSLNAIMRNASWRDARTFAVHYHKDVTDPGRVQRAILETANNV